MAGPWGKAGIKGRFVFQRGLRCRPNGVDIEEDSGYLYGLTVFAR
jgi:hypothetical protein